MLLAPLLMLTILSQATPGQPPRVPATPRDAPPAREGTAVIRGRVTAVDTGQPLRRAFVSLSGGPVSGTGTAPVTVLGAGSGSANPRGPRTVATNADGGFEFTALPGGTYRIRVTAGAYRGHYLQVPFGGRSPMDAGQPIELKDGERFQADVALPRGGAIVGRVVDDFGEPVSRVMVFPSRVMPGGSIQRTGGGFNQTDDLGRFRLYGLEPGEYVVGAEARGMGGPPLEGVSEGFVITYFPSALNEREASRVRVVGTGDSGDVEIMLVRTRTFQISGTIMDSQGRMVMRPNAMLMRPTGGGSGFSSSGVSNVDASGKFTIRDVVPGEYRLVVRPAFTGPPSEQPPQKGQPRPEYATVPLSVSADIEDLVVVTQPGTTVSGQVVFAEGTPPTVPSGIRIMAQPGERMMMMGPSPNVVVGSNLQFTLTDMFGPQLIRVSGLQPGHALKAVMLGATEITDTPVEFKPDHSRQLEVVVTTRASTLDGIVTNDRGEPAEEVMVLAIPEDKSSWKVGSPRLRMTGVTKGGKFELRGLLAGRYYVVAFPRGRVFLTPDLAPEAFEPLVKDATAVVVGEDDKRTIDLRLAKDPQER